MKVCLIVEGAYPYVTGGVSSWVQQLLLSMPDVEFVIQAIAAMADSRQQFKYKIPPNVTQIQEVYLLSDDYVNNRVQKKIRLTGEEYDAFESLIFGENPDWNIIIRFFAEKEVSLNALLSGKDFFRMTRNYYNENYKRVIFSDFLWTMRSLFLPLFTILKSRVEKADLYHSVSNGYAGIWGSLQKCMTDTPFLMTEHGLYIREREEEIIKADWVNGIYKELWIDQFKKIGRCCYDFSDRVISLFEDARKLQIEMGCMPEKTLVIPNGVNYKNFADIPQKDAEDSWINVGAVLRVTPIKDVKTLLAAFAIAKEKEPRLKLWIMGGMEEAKQYAEECRTMVLDMQIQDVVFTGAIHVKEYIGKMDFMILTSLSEGQPLSILEGFAAKKPYIATNVGNCRGLIQGEQDNYGSAGYIVPVMGVKEIARAILKLAEDKHGRERMGAIGYQRVCEYYEEAEVFKRYHQLYKDMI
ncbi:GT4 family glycosyltransferase PelF [Acetivibrio ethanolgignens]|uniref:Glycosyl transferase family 1 n=1 Tax=Acetivibrio ethanolgignens TaxID=290052 RepID=A0A0V8QFY6_9FIRM|nr:GT4 family glycosyltransferase PelF [Acetivibrio ethanolgignens]KSV59471.1 glycosyl transferase family 1 [Acetivibrio ethanolgignens]